MGTTAPVREDTFIPRPERIAFPHPTVTPPPIAPLPERVTFPVRDPIVVGRR